MIRGYWLVTYVRSHSTSIATEHQFYNVKHKGFLSEVVNELIRISDTFNKYVLISVLQIDESEYKRLDIFKFRGKE